MAEENGGGAAMITLISSDNARFEVPEAAALLSQTVRRLIDESGDGGRAGGVPLPGVDAVNLAKVIEYCIRHAPVASASSEEEAVVPGAAAAADRHDLESFDKEFIDVDPGTLCSIIAAADNLKVTGLVELASQTMADMIKGNTPEQVKKMFKIESDLTPEEQAAIRAANRWAFE